MNLYAVDFRGEWVVFCYAKTPNRARFLSYHYHSNEPDYIDTSAKLLIKDVDFSEGVEDDWDVVCERHGFVQAHDSYFTSKEKLQEYEKAYGLEYEDSK